VSTDHAPPPQARALALVRQAWQRVWDSWIGRRWLLTRGFTLLLLLPQLFDALNNVDYYYLGVNRMFGAGGLGDTLREYPPLSIIVFALPRLVSGHYEALYEPLFVVLMLVVDAAFTASLWRAAGRRPATGLTLWLWLLPALGPLSLARLDLVPAVLGGGALLAVARRPVLAGTLAALGAAVKLWPAALVPSLWLRTPLSERSARWRMLAAFLLVGAATCLVMIALAGTDRLVSPLTWQSDRSLQVESYAALPLLVAGVFSPGTWHVDFTRFLAFEVSGPGVSALLTAASVATVAVAALLAVLWLRAARLRVVSADAVGWLATATVALVVLTDKTLSPQYLLWIAALLAALGVTGTDPALPRATRLMLASAVLTQLVYPTMYTWLTQINPIAVALLTVRDVVLVMLTWLAVRRVWALTAVAAAQRVGTAPAGGAPAAPASPASPAAPAGEAR
jgi:hypothetical protein